MNTSATGGALQPAALPAPLEDPGLTDFFQALVVSLTGLLPTSVFPRWQEEPPNLPAYGTNWAAIGITNQKPDTYASVKFNPYATDEYQLQRHEYLELMASFYGPSARNYASLFSDNLQVPQNREILTLNTMGLKTTGGILSAPALIQQRWTMRADLPFTIKRGIKRVYPVLTVESFKAEITVDANGGAPVTFPVVSPPTP